MSIPLDHVPGEIHALPYNRANAALRYEIAMLQHLVAPETVPLPVEPLPPEHDPALDALSFYLMVGSRMVSYAAVVYLPVRHDGIQFQAAGLSCVATDPAYQRRGLGARVVAAATRSIEQSTTDIGMFTCDPPLAAFYWRAGAWPVVPDVTLIGSRDPAALTSAALHKVVLMRLLSPRAQAAAASLRNTTIDLDLPVGQFL